MTEFESLQLQIADDEGFVDRRGERFFQKDVYKPEPLIIASDEGMIDRREDVLTRLEQGVEFALPIV